jgi:hypothetical protein
MSPRRPKGKHQLLLMALACGATVEAAASRAGLSERTAYRLLATPWFREQLQAVWSEMLQRATGMLTAGSLEASKTAIKLAQSAGSEGVQLGAARLVLEQGRKARHENSLATRIAALEEQCRIHMQGQAAPRKES